VRLPIGAALVVIAALSARAASERRRRGGLGPRLVYGPVPIISIKYMSGAMRSAGY